jgi:hypothetical protein
MFQKQNAGGNSNPVLAIPEETMHQWLNHRKYRK